MAVAEVNQVWQNIWAEKPSFVPFDPVNDSISVLTRAAVIKLDTGKRITFVDVGAGPGSRTIPVVGADSFINIVLLDQSQEALSLARKHALRLDINSVNFIQADGFTMPFDDGSLECVFANGLNEHFQDPLRQELIEEMARVVAPGGLLALIVPNKWNPFYSRWKITSERNGVWPFGPQFDFDPVELQERMDDCNLFDITLQGVGAFTSWIRMIPRSKQRKFYISPTPSKLLNSLLWKIDTDTSSFINRYFGREILVTGRKPSLKIKN